MCSRIVQSTRGEMGLKIPASSCVLSAVYQQYRAGFSLVEARLFVSVEIPRELQGCRWRRAWQFARLCCSLWYPSGSLFGFALRSFPTASVRPAPPIYFLSVSLGRFRSSWNAAANLLRADIAAFSRTYPVETTSTPAVARYSVASLTRRCRWPTETLLSELKWFLCFPRRETSPQRRHRHSQAVPCVHGVKTVTGA